MQSLLQPERSYENEYLGYIKVPSTGPGLFSMKRRERLAAGLEALAVQAAVVTSVLVDMLIVTGLLLMEFNIITAPTGLPQTPDPPDASPTLGEPTLDSGDDTVQKVQGAFHVVHLSVLAVYVLEMLLRFAALGVSGLRADKLTLLDGVVVGAAAAVYVTLTTATDEAATAAAVSYLLVVRWWRLGRIYNNLTRPVRLKAEKMIVAHRRAWKAEQAQLRLAQDRIHKQQEEIQTLREHLRLLEQSAQYMVGRADNGSVPSLQNGCGVTTVIVEGGDGGSPRRPNGTARHLPNGTVPGSPGGGTASPASTSSNTSLLNDNSPSSDLSTPDIVVVHDSGAQDTTDSADSSSHLGSPDHRQQIQDRIPNELECGKSRARSEGGQDGVLVKKVVAEGEVNIASESDRGSASQDRIGDSSASTVETRDSASKDRTMDSAASAKTEDCAASGEGGVRDCDMDADVGVHSASEGVSSAKEGGGGGGYMNAAYDAGGDEDTGESEEEIHEIRRVSRVPFDPDSVSSLNKEGIPMTDL